MEVFCKACLTKFKDPSELLHYTEKNRRLYAYSTGLQVKPNDVFPFQICQTCFATMKIACKFKKMCRTSDKRLNNYLALKEAGEETDFGRYLQKTETSMLFRFPVNYTSTPSYRKIKEDDNVSTSTSIRNFMTDLLREDEIPDTEARMIREMIEQEADLLDDSLDSQWLQDDISIASDFRFSPFSTPLSKSKYKPLNYSPVKDESNDEQDDIKNTGSEINGRWNILAAKKLLLNSKPSPSDSETSSISNSQLSLIKRNFVAAKKILLNSKACSDKSSSDFTSCKQEPVDQESYISAKRILLNSKSDSAECGDKIKANRKSMNMETYMATKRINNLNSNSDKDDSKSEILPNYDVAESVTYDSFDENDSASTKKGFYVENSVAEENQVSIRIFQHEKKDCIDKNIEKALNNTNDEVISLRALLASPSSGSARGATPQINVIATPSVHQGLSGANTPTIANILFGETLLDDNQNKPDRDMIDVLSEGCKEDVLKDFFNEQTGEYASQEKKEPDEIFEEFEHPNINKLMPGKCKYDLTDFSCKECNVRYKSERGLKIHFARTHNTKIVCERQKEQRVEIPCDQCGRIFALKSNLSRHIKVMHKAPKVAKACKLCGLEFASEGRLRIHMKSHQGIKHVAERDNANKRDLMCYICGHVSTQPGNLLTHIARHNKAYSYTCDPCGRGFYRKSDLAVHMNIHMGIKPFRCSHCSARFTRRDQLLLHLKRHSEDRPYTCTNCDHKFATAAKLRYHIRFSVTCERKKIDADLKANQIIEESINQFFVTEQATAGDAAERIKLLVNAPETDNKPIQEELAEKLNIPQKASETRNNPEKITKRISENVLNIKSEANTDVEMEDAKSMENKTTKSEDNKTLTPVESETIKPLENKTQKFEKNKILKAVKHKIPEAVKNKTPAVNIKTTILKKIKTPISVKNMTPLLVKNMTPLSVKKKTPILVNINTPKLVENKESSLHTPDVNTILVKSNTPKSLNNQECFKKQTPKLVENKESSPHSPDDDRMSLSDICDIPTMPEMPFMIETDRIV